MVINEWELSHEAKRLFDANNMASPTFYELAPNDPQAAQRFADAITDSKNDNPDTGPAVYVYPTEEYQDMRLNLTEDGMAGVAVKPNGDTVCVFSRTKTKGNGGMVTPLLELAVSAGGRKLDCFDTVLPDFYARAGFRAVARNSWNEEFAPNGWNKDDVMKNFNNGEPDVVFMVYDPNYFGDYQQTDGEVFTVESGYDDAVDAQGEAVQKLNPDAKIDDVRYSIMGNTMDMMRQVVRDPKAMWQGAKMMKAMRLAGREDMSFFEKLFSQAQLLRKKYPIVDKLIGIQNDRVEHRSELFEDSIRDVDAMYQELRKDKKADK